MNAPLFGANVDPSADAYDTAFALAQLAETNDLDLLLVQDHPYNNAHLDTWTLLSTLAAQTERIHIGTNVANVPLRTPLLLAKMAASLDVLSGGRVELGIGAGAFWRGILAYGGDPALEDSPFTAFKEALAIIRGAWEHSGSGFNFDGELYNVKGAMPGPAPAHPIRIWVGGYGPKMLQLTGAQAGGITLSSSYISYRKLPDVNRQIDEAARAAGRDPDDVRRLYNVMGTITDAATTDGFEGKQYRGTRQQWIDQLVMLYRDYGQDAFVFWPTESDPVAQMTIFATEIVPAVKEALS